MKMKNLEKEFYKDKYPEGYINHYLAMYSVNRESLSDQDFEIQNKIYIECEGTEEFQNLRNEVTEAKQMGDLQWFLKLAISYEINDIDLNNLKRMFEAIEKFRF
jgi:hypothetical protein